MKILKTTWIGIVLVTAAAAFAQETQPQQPPKGPGFGPGPGHRPPPPMIVALDANRDGVIDAAEITNAAQALMQLDANNDGQLTPDELRPPHPPGGRCHDGPPPEPRPGNQQ